VTKAGGELSSLPVASAAKTGFDREQSPVGPAGAFLARDF
jgi:hypothetical protein